MILVVELINLAQAIDLEAGGATSNSASLITPWRKSLHGILLLEASWYMSV
jgi:hypothetical protein